MSLFSLKLFIQFFATPKHNLQPASSFIKQSLRTSVWNLKGSIRRSFFKYFSSSFQVRSVSSQIRILREALNHPELQAWIFLLLFFLKPSAGCPFYKADFASACLEVSIALKCSNPSSTFRQPFLTHSRAAVPASGRTTAHVCIWVCSASKIKKKVFLFTWLKRPTRWLSSLWLRKVLFQ